MQVQETNTLVGAILDVQPRLGGGGGGKSNDDIAYELAENILGKLMDKFDLDDALKEMFEPDDKGRLNSLTTVLTQEIDRFNKLLKVIKVNITIEKSIQVYILGWFIIKKVLKVEPGGIPCCDK